MASKEQIPAARVKYLHVRVDSAVDSVHHVHGVPAAVLQAGPARARAAPQAGVSESVSLSAQTLSFS